MIAARLFDTGGIKAAGAATAGDLSLINRYALKPLSAADVACYTMQVANDQLDRDGEQFSHEALDDFAVTLPGKGLLEAHQWGPVGLGLFYAADVQQVGDVRWLMGKCYLLTADKAAAAMIVKLNGGVAKWVSIGFNCPAKSEVYVQNSGQRFVEWGRGPAGEPCEALEASLVFLGAQYDASVVKAMTQSVQRRAVARKSAGLGFVVPKIR